MSISKQFDQMTHGDVLCICDSGGNVMARTPGNIAIDHLTADQIVMRWNAHNELVGTMQAIADELDGIGIGGEMEVNGADAVDLLAAIRRDLVNALAKVGS